MRSVLYPQQNGNTSATLNSSDTSLSTDNINAQSSQENVLSLVPPHTTNYHRLTKLDLPAFLRGCLRMFWDSYESTIHCNYTLTPIQKFDYLKAQLWNTATKTIAGSALTNANYETSISLKRTIWSTAENYQCTHKSTFGTLCPPKWC